MTDTGAELILDGNAAASLMQEIFVLDITTAEVQCGECGSTAILAEVRLYAAPMGAVLRCSQCDNVLLRAVHTPHGKWLEMSGTRYLRF